MKRFAILSSLGAALVLLLAASPRAWSASRPEQPAAVPSAAPVVVLDAVGDVMPGWGIRPFIERYGSDAPFDRVRAVLDRADAVIGNLECPLSDRGVPTKAKTAKALKLKREFLLRASPDAAPGIARARFAALTLANNHAMDYGPLALGDTLAALRENGVMTTGAGENIGEALAPAFFERRGVRFALIGMSEVIPRGYLASSKTAGIAPGRDPSSGEVNPAFVAALAERIRAARRNADIVIIYEHWGKELIGIPSEDHIRLARAAIDAGAALVIGAHPHVLGPIERYHAGLIAYTLGNFVFDTGPDAQTSEILEVRFRGGAIESWRTVPVTIVHGVPSLDQAATIGTR
jgi:poly-gamma-glutamate capsule biosynthesis protein CapA/YwtB (metallophosphatase superfamily)